VIRMVQSTSTYYHNTYHILHVIFMPGKKRAVIRPFNHNNEQSLIITTAGMLDRSDPPVILPSSLSLILFSS
ncbi:hypothetical protein THOM_2310, partial [Trachipleistophora hominis]